MVDSLLDLSRCNIAVRRFDMGVIAFSTTLFVCALLPLFRSLVDIIRTAKGLPSPRKNASLLRAACMTPAAVDCGLKTGNFISNSKHKERSRTQCIEWSGENAEATMPLGKTLGRTIVVAIACCALSVPEAQARPRLLKMLGVLAGPMGVIAGASAARARARHQRSVATPPREAAEMRTEKRRSANDWAGPLYWPYAYDDVFNYVFREHDPGDRFWTHGYSDALDGVFVPAGAASERQRGGRGAMQVTDNNPGNWQSMCASQNSNPADALGERIRTAVQPTAEQTAAFDSLQDALKRAAARVDAACPTATAASPTDQLDVIGARLLAMRQAGTMVLAPLRTFYATLTEDQKTLLDNAASESAGNTSTGDTQTTQNAVGPPSCPEAAILKAMEAQRAAAARRGAPPRRERDKVSDLEMLQMTSAGLGRFVASSCIPAQPQSAPERLEAVQKRLNLMRFAVTHTRPALDQYMSSLSPAQKARLSALGR